MRGNLRVKGYSATPLWFGTGFHFAMEDFHGAREYAHPADAWLAYFDATAKSRELPPASEALEHRDLGVGMLNYYEHYWLRNRLPYDTYTHNGRLCTELNFEIPIPFDQEKLDRWGYDAVVYAGTFDRVVIDEDGLLWIIDYKTAKSMRTQHFLTDAQCTAYIWAGAHLFPIPVQGIIYQQHLKALPSEPTVLRAGDLSTNSRQRTSYGLYRESMIALYGSVEQSPPRVKAFLDHLVSQETDVADAFIRRDKVHRNTSAAHAEGAKILAEAAEMLNPETPLYPNPTRDCEWDCDFRSACISFDDGSDFEFELDSGFEPERQRTEKWRTHLKQQTRENVFLQ